ncbi:MAG TPA: FAD-dependent monooxygenase [Thermoanaerobaculia bacterium]|nr:FAD-dependent monooxygenase [Thermoanaerobaculia bacterium]
MRIRIVGGGPAGLYLAILMKRADPEHYVVVLERNRPDDTFGFGVVFSDATIAQVEDADEATYRAITEHFVHWDDIDVRIRREVVRSTGHGFAGMSRHTLLRVLQEQAAALGVELRFETELGALEELLPADLVVGADGVNSRVRELLAGAVEPSVDWRPNRFVWLGARRQLPAFTFSFRENEHGLWRLHAYQYERAGAGGEPAHATFIVECTEETFRSSGLAPEDEATTARYCADLFAEELDGHPLITNRSTWRSFPTVRCGRWWTDWRDARGDGCPVVLIGDAAHTAHFSVGSGTRMAMLDAIALRDALAEALADGADDLRGALDAYDAARRPQVESLQRAAQASLEWFEATERYLALEPLQFAFTLITRSLRITHEDLRLRDPELLARVDAWFAEQAQRQSGVAVAHGHAGAAPPPMFTPFRLRELVIPNRVAVSPMCQYCAADGTVGDWHLQHLGSRAVGGAGLVIAEMTDVSRAARISPGCAGLYRPEHVGAWKRIVDFVHRHTPAKIGIQLGHAGRKGATKTLWEGDNEPLEEGGWELISASPIPYFPDRSQTPREMSRADMDETVVEYVRAAEYALEAGFDLLEVHMAHGYLLASFVSPLLNRREDEYGGPIENRMRFPLEVFDAVRAAWPAEKPMSSRVSAVDWAPGGTSPEDTVQVARLLAAHGCDVVDVSAGQTVPDQRPVHGRLFQTPFADRVRHEADIATMAVGNISSYMDVNTILAAGRADLCLLARAHLFDPYWTRHAAYMLGWDLEWPPQYRSVSRYTPRFEFLFTGEG